MRKDGRLRDSETDLLRWLTVDEWQRPMDIGGTDGSHHSSTLKQLIEKGFVVRRRRSSIMNSLGSSRGSYEYRKSPIGQMVGFVRLLASYGCAGIDQEPDAETMCGKCGPCEAAAFLKAWEWEA